MIQIAVTEYDILIAADHLLHLELQIITVAYTCQHIVAGTGTLQLRCLPKQRLTLLELSGHFIKSIRKLAQIGNCL